MTHTEIAARFNAAYNGERNFMTPNVERYGKAGRLLYELSSGRGFGRETIYGVTVIDVDGNKRSDLSNCFATRDEAAEYIVQKVKASA